MISTRMPLAWSLPLAFGFAFLSAVPAFSDSAKSQVVERELRSEYCTQQGRHRSSEEVAGLSPCRL